MLDLFAQGFLSLFTIPNMLLMIAGVAVGILFGSIPGLTATMAVALCLPITFGLSPTSGFALLIALYIGGVSGGLISAILLNMPGTPASLATTFDGAPMARNGEAAKAIGLGVVFSFLGTIFSIAVLVFVAPPLAKVALKFGPFEYFAIALFSLSLICGLSGNNLTKGLISGMMGVAFATVGIAPIDGLPRFTFGFHELDNGFHPLPAIIGLFAISEIMSSARESGVIKKLPYKKGKIKGYGFSLQEFKSQIVNFFRSSVIGSAIGILPGIGGGTSNILAYSAAKRMSKHPEKFGTGINDGVVASESANNASIGGAMIPLLCLGIPGDGVTTMLLGGFLIHGLNPGPLLFVNNADLVYTIFAALIIASIIMLVIEFYGLRIFIKLLDVPKHILLPIILVLCGIGSFGVNSRMFDVWTLVLFGVIGYLLVLLKFPLPPMVLGFILGPIVETNLRRGLQLSQGSFIPFITQPISGIFILITIIFVGMTFISQIKKSRKNELKDSINL
ncbi:tripartite tricarboxylate transporter permease [Bacillus sp. Marseille-P3661]|uniref:tripartite tricarboxylate transporter permease n=1 Tax=Bacillus sp. Marseille-P3661 TaxID=1936234 RepID=UPI000C84E14C|nr:tripartite tricarboxylate transporter permease [Bacillus sp. Marseille-P3661]